MKKDSEVRHIYLYAKYHYEVSENKWRDLKKALVPLIGDHALSVRNGDVLYWLCKEVYKYINNSDMFERFISSILPDHIKCLFYPEEKEKTTDELILNACLVKLRCLHVDEININLGRPDSKVLPLNKNSEEFKKEVLFRKF